MLLLPGIDWNVCWGARRGLGPGRPCVVVCRSPGPFALATWHQAAAALGLALFPWYAACLLALQHSQPYSAAAGRCGGMHRIGWAHTEYMEQTHAEDRCRINRAQDGHTEENTGYTQNK